MDYKKECIDKLNDINELIQDINNILKEIQNNVRKD